MITVYWRPQGTVVKGNIESLRSKKTVWVDCLNPTKQELEEISKLTHVPVPEFQDRVVDYERPTTSEEEKYSLIVFGAPVLNKGVGEGTSLAIFLCNNQNLVTIRTEEIEGMTKFKEDVLAKNPKHIDSSTKMVQFMLARIIDTYFEHLELFQESADKIESTVFENPQKKAIHETFKIRKAMLIFHKTLVANREVISSIEKHQLSRLDKKDIDGFRDMREDVLQLMDTADTLRNVLTVILEIYTSSMSNQMNQVIKKLTVVASYVLIPTLIASIYGMNFRFMPEIPWKWGYPFSLALMIASILLVYYYFRKSKML